jgi:hypothetical protein
MRLAEKKEKEDKAGATTFSVTTLSIATFSIRVKKKALCIVCMLF